MARRKWLIDGQIDIFTYLSTLKPKKKSTAAPRASLEDCGITRQRYRELTELLRSGRYADIATSAACAASETLAPWILLSVTKKRSWDKLEYNRELGRIPCGRTDFYGYRRRMIAYFDEEMRKRGL